MLAAGLPLLATRSVPVAASTATPPLPLATKPPCSRNCPTAPPSCVVVGDFCVDASPSPEIVVISPVPLDPPPPPSTPSYLIGTLAPPSPTPPTDSAGSPVPLGGGFNTLPTNNPAAATSSSSGNSSGGGPPLPLFLAGFLLVVGAAAAVLYAVAPVGDRFPERLAGSSVGLNPSGSESSGLNLVDTPLSRRPRARRPRAGL